jgi:hypothetical protein
LQQGNIATHQLKSQGRHHQQAAIAARHPNHSPTEEPRTGIISKLQLQQSTTATHKLESQEQTPSASYNCSKTLQPLTNWRAKNRHYQQATIAARHYSHSQTKEPRTDIISRPQLH